MGRVLPFVIAALLSVVVLFTPESGVPTAPPGTDKVVHAALFALLALTGLYAKIPRILPLLVVYAGVSEVLQQVVTPLRRSGDVLDALVDVAGIALGWAIATWIRSRRRGPRTTR
ncbi:VanZ like family protein [Lentzea xinjiangensis]|uniref:VanZ like family protein n=1 Tax=Lentzea xinjiangensis TaxID=402600 RepID=A0A1H9GJ01_9PSEU|nr:VanZ family protein [Lentzea xinjiangensis]SEQ50082.1 VanZ like family protein [Lentzea xinjiangensis]